MYPPNHGHTAAGRLKPSRCMPPPLNLHPQAAHEGMVVNLAHKRQALLLKDRLPDVLLDEERKGQAVLALRG